MDYSMDLSTMFLEDLELFPECALPFGAPEEKNEQPTPTSSNLLLLAKERRLDNIPSFEDGQFPDWLDLKMDLSFLEGLESPVSNVLDDLLLDEVTTGQSLNVLPTLQAEDKFTPSLEFGDLPLEEDPLPTETFSTTSSPPSSPECCVPEVTPDSPVSLASRPESPSCSSAPLVLPPYTLASADNTFLTFVAPVVSALGVQTLPLDVFNLSFVPADLGTVASSMQIDLQPDLATGLPFSDKAVDKPKRERKRKATASEKESPAKLRVLMSQLGSDFVAEPATMSKKERKRQQNKDAAMRYRQKKRVEIDTTSVEESELLQKNKQLKEKAQQLATELGYLKNLMREMFKAKGLMK